MGAVVRNDRGEAVAGGGEGIANVLSPASAEAMALLKGLVLVEQLGCSPVTVESDSLKLVQLWNGMTEVLSRQLWPSALRLRTGWIMFLSNTAQGMLIRWLTL